MAVKAKDKTAVAVFRLLKAAVQNRKIEKMMGKTDELSDADFLSVLKAEIKKRQDSIAAYQAGHRQDLVSAEEAEFGILKRFMPAQVSETELREIVITVIKASGLSGAANFGKIMSAVMAKVNGRADGQMVSKLVKEEISQ